MTDARKRMARRVQQEFKVPYTLAKRIVIEAQERGHIGSVGRDEEQDEAMKVLRKIHGDRVSTESETG